MKRVLPIAAALLAACSTHPPVPGALPPLATSLPLQKVWTYADAAETARNAARLPLAASDCCTYWVDGAGTVHGFDARGRTLWRSKTNGMAASGIGIGPDAIYVGSREGEVWSFNPADGALRWRVRVSSEVIAAPAAVKDVVVVHAVDGRITGLAADDGHVLWTHETKVPLLSLRGASSPVIADDHVLIGLASGDLLALKLWDGSEIWRVELASSRGRSELERMVDADATPRVRGGVAYAAAFHGRVAAIDIRSGRTMWTREISSSIGLAVDDANVYVTDNEGVIWAVAQSSGTVLWKQSDLSGRGVTAPAAFRGSIVVGDRGGYLNWLKPETGEFVHRQYVDAAPFDVGGVVYRDVLYTATRGGAVDAYAWRKTAGATP